MSRFSHKSRGIIDDVDVDADADAEADVAILRYRRKRLNFKMDCAKGICRCG